VWYQQALFFAFMFAYNYFCSTSSAGGQSAELYFRIRAPSGSKRCGIVRFKLCARQSNCLCIASEISAKLFDFLRANVFIRFAGAAALKNVSVCTSRASNVPA